MGGGTEAEPRPVQQAEAVLRLRRGVRLREAVLRLREGALQRRAQIQDVADAHQAGELGAL